MADTTLKISNAGKPAPRWFRKFKKIFVNTENAALVLLLYKFPADGIVIAAIKIGSSWLLENMETILANGENYTSSENKVE